MSSLRRSWIVRALFVAMVALLVGEQGFAHVCPMHATASDQPATSTAAHHGATDHDTHQAPQHHGACDCLAGCAAAMAVVLTAPSLQFVPALVARESRPAVFLDALHVSHQHARHVLPFPNAPPIVG